MTYLRGVVLPADRNEDGQFCREVSMTAMTKEIAPQGDSCGADDDLDDERDHPFFADPAEVTAETYPSLRNISVGFIVRRVARALDPASPEYVTLPLEGGISDAGHLVAIAKWNLLWEVAQFRLDPAGHGRHGGDSSQFPGCRRGHR